MKKLLLIFSLLMLPGCGILKEQLCDYQVILPEKKPIEVDKRLLEECDDFVSPVVPLTWEGVLVNIKENKLIHTRCMNKQKASVIVLKQVSNNK